MAVGNPQDWQGYYGPYQPYPSFQPFTYVSPSFPCSNRQHEENAKMLRRIHDLLADKVGYIAGGDAEKYVNAAVERLEISEQALSVVSSRLADQLDYISDVQYVETYVDEVLNQLSNYKAAKRDLAEENRVLKIQYAAASALSDPAAYADSKTLAKIRDFLARELGYEGIEGGNALEFAKELVDELKDAESRVEQLERKWVEITPDRAPRIRALVSRAGIALDEIQGVRDDLLEVINHIANND